MQKDNNMNFAAQSVLDEEDARCADQSRRTLIETQRIDRRRGPFGEATQFMRWMQAITDSQVGHVQQSEALADILHETRLVVSTCAECGCPIFEGDERCQFCRKALGAKG